MIRALVPDIFKTGAAWERVVKSQRNGTSAGALPVADDVAGAVVNGFGLVKLGANHRQVYFHRIHKSTAGEAVDF